MYECLILKEQVYWFLYEYKCKLIAGMHLHTKKKISKTDICKNIIFDKPFHI